MCELSQRPAEVVTEIEMSHSVVKWLIIEGDGDDKLFLARPFSTNVRTVVAKGWENVVEIIKSCEGIQGKLVIGLIDRDYRDMDLSQPSHDNLFITDYRDIENILFETAALKRVFAEYGSRAKMPIDDYGNVDDRKIRALISNAVFRLGKFRAYCHCSHNNVCMKNMDYLKFYDDKSLEIQDDKFVKHLHGLPGNTNYAINSFWEESSKDWIAEEWNHPVFIRHGHDIMAVVAISLRRKWGSHGGKYSREDVESFFRSSIDAEELQEYDFWKQIAARLGS